LHENEELMGDLVEEKNRLDNRLGRILNHSSNEIFMVNAHNLKCIQINKGAAANLGYDDSEISGVNILDIFSDLNRESFGKLLQPLMNGRREIAVHRGTNQRRDGSTYPVEARMQLQLQDDPPAIIIIAEDTTERDRREERLIYQANFDQLTGLPNRHYMQQHMDAACVRAKRQKRKIALLFIDLDNFKDINDTLGHRIGDELLRQTAKRIKSLLRASDMPARTGGDEFMVMLEGLKQQTNAEDVANKLADSFRQPFLLEEHEIFSTISIGISMYPDDGDTMEDLMQHADIAMYNVKQSGRNDFRFFSGEMRDTSDQQAKIASHLRHALERNEMAVHFQPKVNIITGRIEGAEALLRWTDSELGTISPDQFIPMAENMGIIKEIGAWVLMTACQEAANWQHIYEHPFHVSVNISPRQFISGNLLEDVDAALVQSGLRCDQLELEITESLLMHSSDRTIIILEELRERGITLAMDDFGTGYSSLSYLKHFPLQVLKIDRSFIADLENSEDSRILVEAIISMAQSLKMNVVAEGIETRGQLDFCRQHNVQTAQGYLFSKPLSAQEHTSLLQYAPDAYRTIVTHHDASDVYWRPISDMAD
jgi:diguanylate cyclase (GGDEF)-like protein/PAS domain S-box-containing protein